MTLGGRVMAATGVAVGATVLISLLVQRSAIRQQGIEAIVATMRSAMVEAESVRESVAMLGKRSAFDQARLLREYKAGGDLRSSTLYATVPVVAAWNGLQKVATQEAFEFRVPKRQARNPKNLPTPSELEILRSFEEQGGKEYVRVDEANNLLVYCPPHPAHNRVPGLPRRSGEQSESRRKGRARFPHGELESRRGTRRVCPANEAGPGRRHRAGRAWARCFSGCCPPLG